MRRYYLSRFEGDGHSAQTAYRPFVARFGKCDFIDLRPDSRLSAGWCIACVDSDTDPSLCDSNISEPDFVMLCDDARVPLPEEVRERMKTDFDLSFNGQSLLEIIVEILLLRHNLRPDANGMYRIYLLGELWSATEEVAFALAAKLLFPKWELFQTADPEPPRKINLTWLRNELELIEELCNRDWLSEQAERATTRVHPIVSAYLECIDIARGSATPHRLSHAIVWLRRVARSLSTLRGVIPFNDRLTSRLRDPGDCESLAFETMVMAGYKRNGAEVVHKDQASGECIVRWGDLPPFHVECKRKTEVIIKERDAKRHLESLEKLVFELMDQRGVYGTVEISSRFDPTEEDVGRVLTVVRRLIETPSNYRRPIKDGKLNISFGPEPVIDLDQVGTQESVTCLGMSPDGLELLVAYREGKPFALLRKPGKKSGLFVPREYDFARSEGGAETADGTIKSAKCIAWRTEQPWRWLRSTLATLKEGVDQLPRDEPSVLYLEVPGDSVAVAWFRCNVVAQEIKLLFLHSHERISAVVVCSEAKWFRSHVGIETCGPELTMFIEVVDNPQTRNPLPRGARLLGREIRFG